MAGVGGYQAPANPATISGAGSASQRTDGNPGGSLEEANRFAASQAQASPSVPTNPNATNSQGSDVAGSFPPLVPGNSPTVRPDESIMVGLQEYGQGGIYSPNSEADRARKETLYYLLSEIEKRSGSQMSDATRQTILRLRGEI